MATLYSFTINAYPFHPPSHQSQSTMRKTQKGQLTSTLPNSAGAPAVGPPACKKVTMWMQTSTRTYIHTHTMHARAHAHTHASPGHGEPTLPPMLLPPGVVGGQTTWALCFSWPQVIKWTPRVLTISCPSLFSAPLGTASLVCTPSEETTTELPRRVQH